LSKDSMKEYISASEASRIAGPCRETVKGWVRKGYVRGYITPGGHWFVHQESLLRYLKKLEAGSVLRSKPNRISRKLGKLEMVLEG